MFSNNFAHALTAVSSIKSNIAAALVKIDVIFVFIVPLGCIDVNVYVAAKVANILQSTKQFTHLLEKKLHVAV